MMFRNRPRMNMADYREGSRPRDPLFSKFTMDPIQRHTVSQVVDLSSARGDARPPTSCSFLTLLKAQ